ncbi:MAG: extracellular solute-binding protein [Myxococcota bacterium]
MRPLSLLLLASLLAFGCQSTPPTETPAKTAKAAPQVATATPEAKAPKKTANAAPEAVKPEAKSLTVYSGRGAVLVEPLFERFTKATGIAVEVRYDKSTGALAERLATEGKESPADVFFAQDSGYLGALAERGFLKAVPEKTLAQTDERFRPKSGKWAPVSGRARVLVYSPERVPAASLPTSLSDLTKPEWKGRMGWAPSNSSYQAHVSALRTLWGEEKTRQWLAGIKANEPTVYPKNSPQVKAVSSGEIDLGWVNHYYLHKLKASNPELKAANHSFTKGDAGNLMMLSGAGITAHTTKTTAAEKLLAFLVSDEAQTYFATNVYEYPVRATIARHPDVPPLSENLVQVKQAALTDVSGTVALLRSLGLN